MKTFNVIVRNNTKAKLTDVTVMAENANEAIKIVLETQVKLHNKDSIEVIELEVI